MPNRSRARLWRFATIIAPLVLSSLALAAQAAYQPSPENLKSRAWFEQARFYGTRGGSVKPGGWGVTTQRANTLYVHVLDPTLTVLALPGVAKSVRDAHLMNGGASVSHQVVEGTVVLQLPKRAPDDIDQVIVLELGS